MLKAQQAFEREKARLATEFKEQQTRLSTQYRDQEETLQRELAQAKLVHEHALSVEQDKNAQALRQLEQQNELLQQQLKTLTTQESELTQKLEQVSEKLEAQRLRYEEALRQKEEALNEKVQALEVTERDLSQLRVAHTQQKQQLEQTIASNRECLDLS